MNKGSQMMPRANVFRIHNPNCPECGGICHEAISFDKDGKPDFVRQVFEVLESTYGAEVRL